MVLEIKYLNNKPFQLSWFFCHSFIQSLVKSEIESVFCLSKGSRSNGCNINLMVRNLGSVRTKL